MNQVHHSQPIHHLPVARRNRVTTLFWFLLSFCLPLAAQPARPDFHDWETVSPPSGWVILTGDFNDDNLTDFFGFYPGNNTLWVGIRHKSDVSTTNWGDLDDQETWQFAVGQFDGQSGDDIVGYRVDDGTIWLGRNQGNRFELTQWSLLQPAAGWTIAAGDLNGGGNEDVFAYFSGNDTVWVGHNNGDTLAFHNWGTLPADADWQFDIAEFDGQGAEDFVGYNPSDGGVWVGANRGNGFDIQRWSTVSQASGWDFAPGNFDGQGAYELVGYHFSNGSLWYGHNNGTSFNFTRWGENLEPMSGWSFQSGVFTCQGDRDELLAYQRRSGQISIGPLNQEPAEGYAWPRSAAPGETVQFYASGEGSPRVDIFRYATDETPMTSINYAPTKQTTNPRPWRYGTGWQPSFSLTIPDNWPSGLYAARFNSETGCATYAPFIVKPNPTQKSRVAVLANVATWLAYNTWGGRGKYDGAALVSYLRPNHSAAPVGENGQTHHLARAERWILGWLEDEGYQPDLYTDIDYHDGLVQGYDTLIIGTHPEYWSPEMYTRLQDFLNAGGNLLYLGGNGLFEEGEFNCNRTQMMFLEGDENGPRGPAMFRVADETRPHRIHERTLLGVSTEMCGATGYPFTVLQPDHPLFAGTDVVAGSEIGAEGYNTGGGRYNGAASAWEVDTSDGPRSRSLGCNYENYPVIQSGLPAGLQVLARANPGGTGLETGGEITFYRHSGGGFVFSAGSITFGGSLVIDAQLQQLMRNVLSLAP